MNITDEQRRKAAETKKKTLTLKEKAFSEDYIKTKGNGVKSAKDNYNTNSDNVAGAIAHENLQKPKVKKYIQKLLNNEKIAKELQDKIKEGLDATKPITHEGNILSEYPDYKERRLMSKLLLELSGELKHGNVNIDNRSINLFKQYEELNNDELREELKSILEMLQ